MNTSRFIAQKVAFASSKSFTKWIIRIAIVAVGLSLTVMIIAFAMISGFKKEISDKIFGFWGHIHIMDANISRSIEAVPILKDQYFLKDLDTLKSFTYQDQLEIFSIPLPNRFSFKTVDVEIKNIYPFAMAPAMISTEDEIEGVIIRGLGEEFDWSEFSKYIIEGREITYPQETSSNEVMVSRSLANRLRLNVNDEFIINVIRDGQQIKRKTTISGIYKTGLEEYDQKFIIADLRKVQELLNWRPNQVAGFELTLANIADANIINEKIYFDILPSNLYSETIREKFPNIFEWLDLQDLNAVVILVLMIIVAIINMITSILILIIERSRMIGTLKALGMTNWNIRSIFVHYAAYIIFFGLILGNILGIGICLIQKSTGFIKLDEANYYLSEAPIYLDFFVILILNVASFVVILTFLLIPTYIITKLSPVKILRFN